LKLNFFILFLLFAFVAPAQKKMPRTVIAMNEGWQFVKGADKVESSGWTAVQLPHTWNTDDVMDDVPGYYRGIGWYKRSFSPGQELKGKEISFYFEGANQETEVFINGKKAGSHTGGYTGFSVPVTQFLNWNGENEIKVKVDNSFNAMIAPLTADFTFYGGIYRDVFLVATEKIHFSSTDHGSAGIYITTPSVSDENAVVAVKSIIYNQSNTVQAVKVVSTLYDKKKKKVSEMTSTVSVPSLSELAVDQKLLPVTNPKLWSPEDPYLYSMETRMLDAKGATLDLLTNPVGLRWFRFDANKGFFLNGNAYKLAGASRHQDYKGYGNAVPDELAIKDVQLLKKMGANFLRVAHYPQDPCVLNACDSLGILASVEIPIVNEITESDSFYRNCEVMQLEMIKQNFNHPSVILWCYMNEVLLKPHFMDDKERQKKYFSGITALAQKLEDLTRKEDPYRYTMMADHGNLDQYQKAGLLNIPMVVGWNLYSGWYGGSMEEFPAFLDQFHKAYPSRPFMVTEYGADADPRIRSSQPVRFDKSVEYTTRFHQYYFAEMMKRPYVAGAVVWNLADFNSETRMETMPHINNKGLLEWDRTPKDPYYFYEAMLSKKPFIKILGSCQSGFGIADSTGGVCYQLVQVATNFDFVNIRLNGKLQSRLKTVDGLCEIKIPFKEGFNTIEAQGEKNGQQFTDKVSVQIHLQPQCLADKHFQFRQINVLLGSGRYFVDEKGDLWQPDQLYRKGAWGSVDGKKFKLENNNRLPYGTDKNIIGTNDDPVYQTQQTGIHQYRLDVPAGRYELTLHFAELLGGKVRLPPYNLNVEERDEKGQRRIFNVLVNGKTVLYHFNISDQDGMSKAVVKSTTVVVTNDEGVLIDFQPVEGGPILNALQLKRLDEEVEDK
jgi:beta-galactosidase